MPTMIPKTYYCPKCKKEYNKKICTCGAKTKPVPPYTVRFRWIGPDGMEEHKRLTGTPPWMTQSAAQKGYQDWIAKNPESRKLDAPTFDYMTLYREYKANLKTTVKDGSCLTMAYRMEKYINPYFSKYKVTEITPPIIVKWQNELNQKKYSQKFKNELRGALNHFFNYLIIYKIENPLTFVKGFSRKKDSKREIQFWTESEFKKFISAVDNDRYRTVFAFLYLTGCRKGEALALKWKDINWEKRTVKIKATLSKTESDEGVCQFIATPKSENAYRDILIPESLVTSLTALKESVEEDDYIFGTKDKPMPFNTLEHAFKRYIKKSGVKPIRIHDLRHSHASLLINKGSNELATIYIIAERLGDTVEMIFKTYGHLFPSTQKEIIDKLNIDF